MPRLKWLLGIALAAVLGSTQAVAQDQPAQDKSVQDKGDGTAPILRIETGMHGAVINRIALIHGGGELATVSDDKTARLWSLATGKSERVWRTPIGEGDIGGLYAVAASDEVVAVGGRADKGGVLFIFDLKTRELRGSVPGFAQPISSLAFSRDGKLLAVGLQGKGGLFLIDLASHATKQDHSFGDTIQWISFAADGTLAASGADGTVRLFSADLKQTGEAKLPPDIKPWGVAYSPDGATLAVGSLSGGAYLFSAADQKLQKTLTGGTGTTGGLSVVAWSGDGKLFAAAGTYKGQDGKRAIRFWQAGANFGSPADTPVAMDTITDIGFRGNGEAVYASAEPSFGIASASGTERQHHASHHPDYRDGWQNAFKVSRDGSIVDFPTVQGGKQIFRFDLQESALTAGPTPRGDMKLAQTSDPKLAPSDWINSAAPKIAGKIVPLDPSEHVHSIAVLANSTGVVLGTDFYLRAQSAGGEVWKVVTPAPVWSVDATADGHYVVAALGDGTIRWYTAADGKEAMDLFVDPDDKRWAAWLPQGFFDHSVAADASKRGGETLVGYQINHGNKLADFVQIGQLYDEFYRRDLVLSAFSGDKARQKVVEDQTARIGDYRAVLKAGLPPSVQLTDFCIIPADATTCPAGTGQAPTGGSDRHFDVTGTGTQLFARYRVVDRDGGIGKIVVRRQNAIIDGTRKVETQDAHQKIETLLLPLDPTGDQVKFSTLTANGAIESPPDEDIVLDVKPTPPAAGTAEDATATQVTLYGVIVGVSQYQQDEFKLGNAANDAKAVAELLKQPSPPVYDKAQVTLLTDQDATVPKIQAALDDVAAKSKPQDIVFVFLSGHGESVDGKYYFAPVDFAIRHQDLIDEARHSDEAHQGEIIDELFRQDGLGEKTLLPTFTKIQGNMLLVLDTCFSSALATKDTLDEKAQNDTKAGNQTGTRTVAHDTGRFVLAGARAYALDDSGNADKHGLFTSFLLRGLSGEADFAHEGKVNVADLLRYAQKSVRDASHKQKQDQEPYYVLGGSNLFDVRADQTAP